MFRPFNVRCLPPCTKAFTGRPFRYSMAAVCPEKETSLAVTVTPDAPWNTRWRWSPAVTCSARGRTGDSAAAVDLTLERRDRRLGARAFIGDKENVEWGDGLLDTPTSKGDEITIRPRRGGRIAGVYGDFPHHFLQVIYPVERVFELSGVRGGNDEARVITFGSGDRIVPDEGKDAVQVP